MTFFVLDPMLLLMQAKINLAFFFSFFFSFFTITSITLLTYVEEGS